MCEFDIFELHLAVRESKEARGRGADMLEAGVGVLV